MKPIEEEQAGELSAEEKHFARYCDFSEEVEIEEQPTLGPFGEDIYDFPRLTIGWRFK